MRIWWTSSPWQDIVRFFDMRQNLLGGGCLIRWRVTGHCLLQVKLLSSAHGNDLYCVYQLWNNVLYGCHVYDVEGSKTIPWDQNAWFSKHETMGRRWRRNHHVPWYPYHVALICLCPEEAMVIEGYGGFWFKGYKAGPREDLSAGGQISTSAGPGFSGYAQTQMIGPIRRRRTDII